MIVATIFNQDGSVNHGRNFDYIDDANEWISEQQMYNWVDGMTSTVVDLTTPLETCYKNRIAEYPDFRDYMDGIVKGDQAQIQTYINECLAVKAKYPKPE